MFRHLVLLDGLADLHVESGILISGGNRVAVASLGSIQSFSPRGRWSQYALTHLAEQCPVVLASWNKPRKKWLTSSVQPRCRYVNPVVTKRICQLDGKRGTRLVSDMIYAKIRNQHLLLRALNPKLSDLPAYKANSSARILALEAKWARQFWGAFFAAAQSDIFVRVHREARDYLNVALNYGYGFLYHALEWQAIATGLEPGIGIGHALRKNRFSLICDLIEPYRCCVDLTVIRNLNQMKDTGLMASRFAEMLEAKWTYRGQRRRLRDIIRLDLRDFARDLGEDSRSFSPFSLHVSDSCV